MFARRILWLVAFVATMAASFAFAAPYTVSRQAVCVKEHMGGKGERPTKGPASARYHIRIPHGQQIAERMMDGKDERNPGDYYKKALSSCHPHNWDAAYDHDGNAHLDFVLRDRRFRMPGTINTCNIRGLLLEATNGEHGPVCSPGSYRELATKWREGIEVSE